MPSPIRLLLADDHEVIRAGLCRLVQSAGDMEVVGEASDGEEAVRRAEASQPDIVLLDLAMPRLDGIAAIGGILSVSARTRILVLTMYDDMSSLRASLAAGAAGYLVKSRSEEEFLRAIRVVYEGRSYVDVSLGAVSLGEVTGPPRGEEAPERLSRRERQVLELIALGHTYREIAEHLSVSIKSVETYRARLREKLGLVSRAELVRYALENGLLGKTAS